MSSVFFKNTEIFSFNKKSLDFLTEMWYNIVIHYVFTYVMYVMLSVLLISFTYKDYYMNNYSKLWTQFETQSLSFGILRKALYPTYLVRGYAGRIVVYKPTVDQNNPEKLLTIHVQASDSVDNQGFSKTGEQECTLVGGNTAYKIVDFVKPLL